MIPALTGTSANFFKITPYPINRVYIPPGMVWYGIVCNISKKGKLNQIAGHDADLGACPAVCSNGWGSAKERSKLMDKKKSSVVDRAVIRGADEIVRKCVRNGRKVVGKVRRSHLLEQAVLAVEHEVAKDPAAFARYIVSRMAWDMLADKQNVDVYVA